MDKNKTFKFAKIWHYISIYLSNLDCLGRLSFLQMFFIINSGLFLFKILQEINVICFHNLAATILNLYLQFF
jgi:hypothetical protein